MRRVVAARMRRSALLIVCVLHVLLYGYCASTQTDPAETLQGARSEASELTHATYGRGG